MMLKRWVIDYLDREGNPVGSFPKDGTLLVNHPDVDLLALLHMLDFPQATSWKIRTVTIKV